MKIRKSRGMRYVRRFNFHHCNVYQNVAEHSYFVALIAHQIALMLTDDIEFIYKCFCRAFYHDIDEAVTGDIPYLVKRKVNVNDLLIHAMRELEYIEPFNVEEVEEIEIEHVVKLADCIELKMYLEDERKSGNMHLYDIEKETYKRIIDSKVDDRVKQYFIRLLDPVEPKELIDNITHEGI